MERSGSERGEGRRRRRRRRKQRSRRVVCDVCGVRMVFSVGDAQQTVRWLALAAAQRFAQRHPRGQPRAREARGTDLGRFVPAVVKGGEVLPPSERLCDVLFCDSGAGEEKSSIDEPEVVVDLQRRVTVSDRCAPVQSTWNMQAFAQSDSAKRDLARREAAEEAVREQERAAQLAIEQEIEKQEYIAKQLQMRDRRDAMLAGKVMSKDTLFNAVKHDWDFLQGNDKIEPMEPEAQDQLELSKLCIKHFALVNDAFKHFAGLGHMGSSFSMCPMEFERFVSACDIVDVHKSQSFMLSTFQRCKHPQPMDADAELERAEFLEALWHLAFKRFCIKGIGGHKLSLLQAFDKLMTDLVAPTMTSLGAGEINEALANEKIQMLINDNIKWIEAVYKEYAEADDSDGGRPLMNLAEFFIVMKDAGLLTEHGTHEAEDEELTEEEVRSAFASAQDDVDANYGTASAEDLDELTFTEFIEALVRVAFLKWEGDRLGREMKVELALDAIVLLAKARQRDRLQREREEKESEDKAASAVSDPAENAGAEGDSGSGTFLTQS